MNLKKLIMKPLMALLAILFAAEATAQESADTIKVIDNPDRVLVVRDSTTTIILAETIGDYGKSVFNYEVNVDVQSAEDIDFAGNAWDIDLPFVRIKDDGMANCRGRRPRGCLTRSVIGAGHIYMGQRFNYNDKCGIKNSFEVGIRNLIGVKWSRGGYCPDFSIGLGFSMQRYLAQQGLVFGKDGSRVVLQPVGEGLTVCHTRLDVHTVQIPVMLTQPIGRNVQFMAGGAACFNFYASAMTEVTGFNPSSDGNMQSSDIGIRHKRSYKGFQQRLLTADIFCALGLFESVGVYASWSPVPLFQAPYGPGLKAWSIGVTLSF